MDLQFPDDFFWGSSTSAAQVETASSHNWKGVTTRDGHLFDQTTDHEKRRDEDIEYIAQFGQVYRCSVDWARLQSSGYAPFDEEVVEEYQVFFDLLAQRGVKIMFVLHHFANPVWFEHNGGWLNEENVSAFVDFARQCLEHFGKYVFNWNTFNEPNVYALNAYLLGHFPPFKKSYFKANRVLKNLGRAHDIIYQVIKETNPHVPVGISLNTAYFEGLNFFSKGPAWFTDWWFHHKAAKPFRQVDYWGLSYYAYVPFTPIPLTEIEHPGSLGRRKIPHDKMWGYQPAGLGIMLRRFWKKYKKPLIVTENGICTDDPQVRIQAIKDYLHVCHQLLEDGIPIQGYIFWSTWDNFEWHLGPTYRFGLVAVDPITKDRKMTEAGRFYHKITQTGTLKL